MGRSCLDAVRSAPTPVQGLPLHVSYTRPPSPLATTRQMQLHTKPYSSDIRKLWVRHPPTCIFPKPRPYTVALHSSSVCLQCYLLFLFLLSFQSYNFKNDVLFVLHRIDLCKVFSTDLLPLSDTYVRYSPVHSASGRSPDANTPRFRK